MLPFYTHYLSVSDFGASDTVMIYVTLLLGVVSLSISESLFVFPKGKDSYEQSMIFTSGTFFSFFVLLIAFGLLVLLNSLFISLNLLQSFTNNFWYIIGLLFVMVLQTATQQFARGIDKLIIYSISGIVLTGMTAILGFLLIPSNGLEGFFLSLILANVITVIYTLVHSRAYRFWGTEKINFSKYKELIKYSTPLIPNAIMWWIISSLNRPMLEKEVGLEGIGILAVALKVPSIINVLFGVFLIAWQASVLEEFGKAGYKRFYWKVFLIVSVLLGICSLIISVFSLNIIGVVADSKFIKAAEFIPLLTLSAFFASLSGLVGANFSAVRKSKYYFYSSILGAFSALVLNIILIPKFGLWGAVYAIIVSQIIMFLSRQFLVHKIFNSNHSYERTF
jgi:O-antigen/teichoic acid export membrane protein